MLFLLSVALASLSVVFGHLQFSCIDITGHISQCPGNVRPTSFADNMVAYARYSSRINQTGWDELELVTNGQLNDSVQAYYGGYLESSLTAKLIKSSRINILQEKKNDWCKKLSPFIRKNLDYTIKMVEQNKAADIYWHQVGLTLYQLAGLDDGYAQVNGIGGHRKPHLEIDPCGVILLNLQPELGDLQSIMEQNLFEEKLPRCSAIVKMVNNDVYVAHNTWDNYRGMLRMLKKYTLNYKSSKAKSISMSSYFGTVYSIDDYYITSANMVIMETTNENHNNSLWRTIRPNNMVFQFIRNIVSNRLADSGEEWVKYYSRENSGTYNNQFMVIDYKRMNQSGLLTVLEQMPGFMVHADKSDHLRQHTYWASFNVPYFAKISKESGQDSMCEKYGDHYCYEKTSRALIFKRDHGTVTNMTTLYHLLRYNDFQHDPISRCNCTPPYTAAFALAARYDLNDPNGKYPPIPSNLGFRSLGAIDAKMTSSKLAKNMEMIAVSGPTDQGVPAFNWATTKLKELHVDQPNEWRFKPVKTEWNSDKVFPLFNFDL